MHLGTGWDIAKCHANWNSNLLVMDLLVPYMRRWACRIMRWCGTARTDPCSITEPVVQHYIKCSMRLLEVIWIKNEAHSSQMPNNPGFLKYRTDNCWCNGILGKLNTVKWNPNGLGTGWTDLNLFHRLGEESCLAITRLPEGHWGELRSHYNGVHLVC